jgi:signal transduction histidine kinase
MVKHDKIPLRQRLVFQLGVPFFIFIFFVFAILFAGSALSLSYGRSETISVPERIAAASSNEISILLSNIQTTLIIASRSASSNGTFSTEQEQYYRTIIQQRPSILELEFFSASGTPAARFASPTMPEMIEKDPASDAANEQIVPSTLPDTGLLFTPTTSIYDTSIAHWVFPIKDADGNVTGFLRATIDLSGLWNILSKYREEGVATLYVVDSAGSVIVANTKLTSEADDSAHQRQTVTLLSLPQGIQTYTGIENNKVYGIWAALPPSGWYLITEVPTDAFQVNTNQTLLGILAIFVGIIVLLAYEILTVRQALLIPLSVLRSAVLKIAAGDYKTRVKLTVDNEFQTLSNVLDQMAENVDASTSSIVTQLKSLLDEQDRNSKLLIRRDFELMRANEKLHKLDETKSEFVSVAAHQLRTPLSAVKWAMHMLIGGDLGSLGEAQREVLRKAAESNDRMIKLVNDLLNVDHIESGKSQYVFVPLTVQELIQSVMTEVRPLAESHGVTLKFDQNISATSKVLGDRDKLRGVFQNLIDNAIKYTLTGGSVNVGLTEDPTNLIITVADSGIGIPAEDQTKTFGKFFRSKNAVKVATDGTGLGLFIVREIVTRHKGKISFTSVEGKGTTFTVLIPKYIPEDTPHV